MDRELNVAEEIQEVSMGRPHVVVLGAGCSLAAFPRGDREGRRLPLMDNLIQVLGLEDKLKSSGLADAPGNFEALYSRLASNDGSARLREDIEKVVMSYFVQLRMPLGPTIYDHLLLSLRSKDCVATFNWDPFLWDAWERVQLLTPQPPRVVFLHGNVRLGICYEHKRFGPARSKCPVCRSDFIPSPLLFPIEHKDYAKDRFVEDQWRSLRGYLKSAYLITIFGYGAPKSDTEAVALMKEAWGRNQDRNLEEIEIINTRPKEELADTWSDFIHTHHYRTVANFYDCWIAKHPRRTCEVMWEALMECRFVSENPIPQNDTWPELEAWIKPLLEAEEANRSAVDINAGSPGV